MAMSLSGILAALSFSAGRVVKIDCYHCGERMRESKALYVVFHGEKRAVCCHGCLAILRAIEQNDMIPDYLLTKSVYQGK